MHTGPRTVLLAALALLLAACSLPRGAGIEREVVGSEREAERGFAVYPVTRALLPSIAEWPVTGEPRRSWISASAGSSERVIRPGDTVEIVIWDSADNSLLLSPGQRQMAMPAMRVSPAGSVFLPYVGNIRIADASPESARLRIQNALAGVAPTAQAQLALVEGRANSVDLVGGVSSPGAYPMPDNRYTVLGLIAAGGGAETRLENPQVTLQRGGRRYGTSLERLYENPELDTRLLGGDKVIVEEDERYFLSVGASAEENLHPFTRETLSALDAVAIVGGVDANRADPEGVLILREYPEAALASGQRGPRQQRVVFTLDLTEADGLFSARHFPIRSGDLIYVSESPVNSVETVFGLVGRVFGLARQANLN
ncbi:polysaccharide biosynthesis/export family protein [Jannaschia sp. W003]|uniref:polysaccharide biosynthesis/export family protein n=1 Tax=Jannaschia sp. W003 TaxID=2867012 RepID=UPI0021A2D96E|nr:polysaccharide biosynthesis/export family protein [Jannaschia sp. W003]UWQ21730.1 polysaccharide export protein [Jannaschia sp. W003]